MQLNVGSDHFWRVVSVSASNFLSRKVLQFLCLQSSKCFLNHAIMVAILMTQDFSIFLLILIPSLIYES